MRYAILIFLLFGSTVYGQTYNLQVLYAEVPGIHQVESGNHEKLIASLEKRSLANKDRYPDEIATLCALYVVSKNYEKAALVCNRAVELEGSFIAYNNRGVFRANINDMHGALEDFDVARVKPKDYERYIEEIIKSDTRIIASSNHSAISKLLERRLDVHQALSESVAKPDVEDMLR